MRSLVFPVLMATATSVQAETPRVAVDIAPLHGLVSQVMEGVGTPDLVIPQGASPHGYAMRPSEARALSSADMVVWVGPGLTPWLSEPLESLAGEAKHLSVMSVEGTNLIPVRRNAAFEAHNHDHGAHDEHGAEHHDDHAHDDHAHDDHVDKDSHADHEDHAHEEKGDHDDHASKDHSDHDDHGHDDHADHDDHGHESDTAGMDPHVWLDPRNAALWVKTVAEELAAMDPANAETYRANAANAQAGLKDLEKQISEKLTGYESNAFIVFHDSYHYFEDRFDVEARAAITFSDGSSASAAQLAEVREVVIETGAACALTEPGANEGLVAAVDEGDTLSIETADAIGVNLPLGSGFYDALLNQISDALVNCFDTSS